MWTLIYCLIIHRSRSIIDLNLNQYLLLFVHLIVLFDQPNSTLACDYDQDFHFPIHLPSKSHRFNRFERIRFQPNTPVRHENRGFFLTSNNVLFAEIKAFDHHLKIIAFRIPVNPLQVKHDQQLLILSPNHYQGKVVGQPDSRVVLFVWRGHLLGHIRHKDEHFHLEHPRILQSVQGFRKNRTKRQPNWSNCRFVIMYRLRDLRSHFPVRFAEPWPRMGLPTRSSKSARETKVEEEKEEEEEILEQNTLECSLEITVDHYYVKEAGKDIEYIVDEIQLLVLMVNRIFSVKKFRNVWLTLRLTNLTIIENPDKFQEEWAQNSTQDAYKLLALYSKHVQTHCASILITGRLFTANPSILGLAFMKTNQSNGVCSLPTKPSNLAYLISLNTGLITTRILFFDLFTFGPLTRGENAINMAHELGHLFGAPHDEPPEGCNGPSLMAPKSNVASKNRQFSNCSSNKISRFLGSAMSCLKQVTPKCGNGYVESGEGEF